MNNYWRNLSARERYLAVITLSTILVATGFMVFNRVRNRLEELDRNIDGLEEKLRLYKIAEARGKSVEKKFAAVAAQHSSAWTEAEIHNKLRQEIYRLAQEDPEAPSGGGPNLVEIPRLRQGSLKDSGEGYREYQLSINIPSTDVYSLVLFLLRLQASQQSLRIDGLELARPPDSQVVQANINVTRTVVAGVPSEGGEETDDEGAVTSPLAPPPQAFTWDGSAVEPWKTDGCELSIATEIGKLSPNGGSCLLAKAGKENSTLFLSHDLPPNMTFELTFEATAKGPVRLDTKLEAEETPFPGGRDIAPDGNTNKYTVRFRTPEGDANVMVQAPLLILTTPGTELYLDNVDLRSTGE